MLRYVREEDARQILTMAKAIELMERAFRDRAQGRAVDVPRSRTRHPGGQLRLMQGAAPELNVIGFKSLGEVLLERRRGRTADSQITLFESHGMALEDIYAGKYVLDAARKQGLGIDLPIGAG